MMKPCLCVYFSPGTWSSPEISGTLPPPSAGHSFTRVDHYRAVQFGGGQLSKPVPNHVYLLDMMSWVRDYMCTFVCWVMSDGKTQDITTCELKFANAYISSHIVYIHSVQLRPAHFFFFFGESVQVF